MASEEDEEIFEITDFTTATEWERFIARIEEVIHEWKLANQRRARPLKKDEIATGKWIKQSEEVTFADSRFNITRNYLEIKDDEEFNEPGEECDENTLPQALEDMMLTENNFPYKAHCLSRWFGLREFVVLTPVVQMEAISSESRVKLLLSSVCIAINNSGCCVPFFIQVHQASESFYVGVCEGGSVRTSYEMVHMHKTHSKTNHLAGLLDVFKGKLATPCTMCPVSVSVRFTFVLHDWTQISWPQQPPDFDFLTGEVGIRQLDQLPFGACQDPIAEFYLSTTWPCLPDDVFVDNDVFSDLDPINAPDWSLRTVLVENPQCLLFEYLSSFLALTKRKDSVDQLVARINDDGNDFRNYSQSLDRLTDLLPLNVNVSSVVSQTKKHVKQETEPISRAHVQEMLYFLFPDVKVKSEEENSETNATSSPKQNAQIENEDTVRSLKSVPVGSLTWRLALCLAHVNHAYKTFAAISHLWSEFVLEMRYRWDISCPLPELEAGLPDLGCCLLHQKLQMLNCCIARKRSREERQQHQSWGRSRTSASEEENASSSDDEFFECTEPTGSVGDVSSNTSIDVVFQDSLPHQPDGRVRRAGSLRLLHADQPLYIPVTQEPTPMTEDLLEQHAEVLVQLGTDAQGAELRAKMQSACLLSDMEAFKAANPGCCLEDFVRWYSPRDWIQEEEGDDGRIGHLSARMLLPGNVWFEVWESAKPIPARRQRRLFDDTREAEKVLHWLSSLSICDLVGHVMPILVHAAILTATKANDQNDAEIRSKLEAITTKAAKTSRLPTIQVVKYQEILHLLSQIELNLARVRSLSTKLTTPETDPNELSKVIYELLKQNQVTIDGASRSPVGMAVIKLFTQAQKSANLLSDEDSSEEENSHSEDAAQRTTVRRSMLTDFPKPSAREFILRATVARPAPYSKPTPQRLFCVLQPDEIRLAGAFTQDTTFQ